MHNLAKETFAECQIGVRFLQKREIAFKHFPSVLLTHISDLVACYIQCVVLCYSCNYFILLSLIVNNCQFLLGLVHELLAEERVPSSDDNGCWIAFGEAAADKLADKHHGSVADSRITDGFVLSAIWNLSVFSEKIFFWYPHTSDQHESVLFGMVAYFWTDVSSLDARKPIMVVILYFKKKRMHTVIFSLY